MKKYLVQHMYFLFVVLVILGLFYKTFLFGLLPIPSDTIIGLYHPYRDMYAADYPNGIPYKNFLITDPVRQIIPWKLLVVESWKQFELPLWNPYEMSGKPLLANFQAGVFYPLNILLFLPNFAIGWTIFIIIQPILAVLFFYLYTRNLKLSPISSAFGALSFSLSGFLIAWMEWGNIIHTFLWLPLILLSIDKILVKNRMLMWLGVYLAATIVAFFAGHLQTFFYVYSFSLIYFVLRWVTTNKSWKSIILFLLVNILFVVCTSIQWIPTLQFILLSSRSTDQNYLTTDGWFIPFQHLIQFIAPDYFGNPTTLNYWGTWNYGEMVGYFGVIPLFFALYAIVRRDRKIIIFYAISMMLFLLLSTQNSIAELPYKYNISFFSTAQPTRLLSLIVFSGALLSSFGLHNYLSSLKVRSKNYSLFISIGIFTVIYIFIGIVTITKNESLGSAIISNFQIAQKNLILPAVLLGFLLMWILISQVLRRKFISLFLVILLLVVTAFDLLRFGNKFLPFTQSSYLFPETKTTTFLQNHNEPFRIASLNSEVMPENFLTKYKLQSIGGYDPLYLDWYARYISTGETNGQNELLNFNRIISPRNIQSPLINNLNVEYILSRDVMDTTQFKEVHQEGTTKVYKNINASPRAYFVRDVYSYDTEQEELDAITQIDFSLSAIVEPKMRSRTFATGSAVIKQYDNNRVVINTVTNGDGFLVFMDTFYPTWSVTIDGKEVPMYRTNVAFRGVEVPKGSHTVIFKNNLFKF
jgi:uncharacterized membrane protein YfhO